MGGGFGGVPLFWHIEGLDFYRVLYDAKEQENDDSSLEMTPPEYNVRAPILKIIRRRLGNGVTTTTSNIDNS